MSHILLVEDEKSTVALLKQYVSEIEPNSEMAAYAEAANALRYAKNNPVDLFILDIQLLDYKGTSLAKQIRAMPEYKYAPIIFATALAGEELTAYREIRCYSFLIKPFSKAEFKNAFCDALEMSRQITPSPKTIRIEQKGFIFDYEIKNIVYIESFGKRVSIHTAKSVSALSEDTISGYSLAKILELAGDMGIVQCHKSFLVNRNYIKKIDKSEGLIHLKNYSETIPIGNKYQHFLRG